MRMITPYTDDNKCNPVSPPKWMITNATRSPQMNSLLHGYRHSPIRDGSCPCSHQVKLAVTPLGVWPGRHGSGSIQDDDPPDLGQGGGHLTSVRAQDSDAFVRSASKRR